MVCGRTILYLYLHLWFHYFVFVFVFALFISLFNLFCIYQMSTSCHFSYLKIIICSHLFSASVQQILLCLHIRSRPTRLCSPPPDFPRWSTEKTFHQKICGNNQLRSVKTFFYKICENNQFTSSSLLSCFWGGILVVLSASSWLEKQTLKLEEAIAQILPR